MREGQEDMSFCAFSCRHVLPPVVKLVVTILGASDHFSHGLMLQIKKNVPLLKLIML